MGANYSAIVNGTVREDAREAAKDVVIMLEKTLGIGGAGSIDYNEDTGAIEVYHSKYGSHSWHCEVDDLLHDLGNHLEDAVMVTTLYEDEPGAYAIGPSEEAIIRLEFQNKLDSALSELFQCAKYTSKEDPRISEAVRLVKEIKEELGTGKKQTDLIQSGPRV